jgi:putative addiction module component (TIGR02574 family)
MLRLPQSTNMLVAQGATIALGQLLGRTSECSAFRAIRALACRPFTVQRTSCAELEHVRWRAPPDGGALSAMKQSLVADILELSVAERVRLVEAIWDSIAAAPQALPLTEWQREELDRRLAEFESDPDSGSTLEEVFARIRRSS